MCVPLPPHFGFRGSKFSSLTGLELLHLPSTGKEGTGPSWRSGRAAIAACAEEEEGEGGQTKEDEVQGDEGEVQGQGARG